MRGRGRALGFLLLALAAAAGAAAIADRYGARLAHGYGPLRPVVVLEAGLRAGQRIGSAATVEALAVRRVPERFVPPGALASPAEALGLALKTPISAGSYMLAEQLGPPRPPGRIAGLAGRRRPVEISVAGAGALLSAGATEGRAKVDVVVTREPNGPGPGRTYVAAAAVPLLALRPGPEGPVPGATAAATLALTRSQALRLIAAESFARKVTVLLVG